ncbi:MAG: hypothetical protein KME10_29685 [Plectolyngbya sp. WJT66-NPBG17]|nr:hypothetical protein [Plectolyngbya sp. WJT66-NPBG17]
MRVPELIQQLSWYNLRKVINDELIQGIEAIVEATDPTISPKLIDKLNLDLKQYFERVINNFRNRKITSLTCVAQLSTAIDAFVADAKACFGDNVHSDAFANAVNTIKVDVFGSDDYEELLNRVQPSLPQVIELLELNSDISKAFFRELEQVRSDPNSAIVEAYEELYQKFQKVSKALPPEVQKSLLTLAVRAQVKAGNVEQELNQ